MILSFQRSQEKFFFILFSLHNLREKKNTCLPAMSHCVAKRYFALHHDRIHPLSDEYFIFVFRFSFSPLFPMPIYWFLCKFYPSECEFSLSIYIKILDPMNFPPIQQAISILMLNMVLFFLLSSLIHQAICFPPSDKRIFTSHLLKHQQLYFIILLLLWRCMMNLSVKK